MTVPLPIEPNIGRAILNVPADAGASERAGNPRLRRVLAVGLAMGPLFLKAGDDVYIRPCSGTLIRANDQQFVIVDIAADVLCKLVAGEPPKT